MRRISKKTLAIATPVANLIILVVAVLLSGAVTYFATNVASTRVQQENLYLAKCHLWYKNSTSSVSCVSVVNTGSTDIVISKITVKGTVCTWNGTTSYVLYNKTSEVVPADLPYVSAFNKTGTNTVQIGGENYDFVVAEENLILPPGWTLMFYMVNPGHVLVYDVGTPVRVTIFTSQSVYCTETIVEAAT